MTVIKFRRDTSANWTSINPIPAQGEPCYETDTGKLKIGNGSDTYTALPYVSDDGGTAGTTDYTQLENKPQINLVELTGNKTLDDLGIQAKGDYLTALPDNAVTTDTEQTITGKKSLPLSTTLGRLSFKANGFDDNSGKLIWTLDSGQSAALQISRYNYFGFLLNDSENWSIRNDDTNKVQTWTAAQTNIVIRTDRGNGLKVVGKNDGRDLELTNTQGDFTFLRSKDVDGSTITFSDGVLKANIPSVNVATTDTVGTVKPDNTTITVNSEGTISMAGTIPTKTSELENDSGFLTEAPTPTNMVTTDTTQTITGSKTFPSVTVSDTAYIGNEITFNGTSGTYINSIKTISGGWKSGSQVLLDQNASVIGSTGLKMYTNSGIVTIGGNTSSGKIVIANGSEAVDIYSGNGGLTLRSKSGEINVENNVKFRGGSALKLNNIANSQSVTITGSSSGYLDIASSSTTGLSTFISMYDKKNVQLNIGSTYIRSRDIEGNTYEYINSQNIDTTYMKWSSGMLTVDTAAVAHLAMPSSTTVDLTLGASGTTYTAPADGYFTANTSSSYTGWFKIASICAQGSTPNGHQFACSCATRNGESPKVWYSFSSGDTSAIIFKFVYANGTVPTV